MQPWITPSLFENTGNTAIVDEWTFGQYQDPRVALATLTEHWDTWITEGDFEAIAAAGCVLVCVGACAASFEFSVVLIFRLNHVRIPIGYWAYDVSAGEPYISGQHKYLLKAIAWAATYNIKVIVDLHGAPGSQNGYESNCLPSIRLFSRPFQISASTTLVKVCHSLSGSRSKPMSTARMQS
jgi:glucan 1,3-beta-glucosidase